MKNYKKFLDDNHTCFSAVGVDKTTLVIRDCGRTVQLHFHPVTDKEESYLAAKAKLAILEEAVNAIKANLEEMYAEQQASKCLLS